MKNNDWKERLNIVYSTNPDYSYELECAGDEAVELPREKQPLKVMLDKRNRKGKTVTLVTGFSISSDCLDELGRLLKTRCGVGGSAKDGEIIIQGDFRDRVVELLHKEGFTKARKI